MYIYIYISFYIILYYKIYIYSCMYTPMITSFNIHPFGIWDPHAFAPKVSYALTLGSFGSSPRWAMALQLMEGAEATGQKPQQGSFTALLGQGIQRGPTGPTGIELRMGGTSFWGWLGVPGIPKWPIFWNRVLEVTSTS